MDRNKLLEWLKTHQKPGVYHNGGFGFPTLQVTVTKTDTGFCLIVFHNSKMEQFDFLINEVNT